MIILYLRVNKKGFISSLTYLAEEQSNFCTTRLLAELCHLKLFSQIDSRLDRSVVQLIILIC